MADTKFSALAAASAAADANEFAINEAGTSKKLTALQLKEYVLTDRHFIRCDVDRALPNDTNLNKIFDAPANGRLTLTTGVYLFEGLFIITGMSTTSGNALINLLGAGTATIGSWLWRLSGLDNSTPATIADDDAAYFQTNATAASAVTAGTGTGMRIHLSGSFECTTAGTLIPSIDLVTATAGLVQDGSYMMVDRIGDSGLVSIGDWD